MQRIEAFLIVFVGSLILSHLLILSFIHGNCQAAFHDSGSFGLHSLAELAARNCLMCSTLAGTNS